MSGFDGLLIGLIVTPCLIGLMAALAAALLGNFLVLRGESLVGDAVSHVVLPGIVAAFVLTGSRASWAMLLGASAAAVLAAVAINAIRQYGKVERGAALGVVFTTMFAIGVVMLEQSSARTTHFDVEHALYGNLESLVWFKGSGWSAFLDVDAWSDMPPEFTRLLVVLIGVCAFCYFAWRPLMIASFDPGFADSVGIRSGLLGLVLTITVAIVAVAAFDAVGAIITIAMLICPAAAARLMTNNAKVQIVWSLVFATVSAVGGYLLAGFGLLTFGINMSASASGMIATLGGLIVLLTCLFGPKRQGVAVVSSLPS